MFSQNVEILCSHSHLRARNDMNLYLVSFSHFAPPSSRRGVFAIPKECDFARIKVRRGVTHSYPVINGWIVLTENFNSWKKRIESRKLKTYFVMLASRLNLFTSPPTPTLGVL